MEKRGIDFLYGCYIYEESFMKVKDEVEGVKVWYMKILCEIGEDMLYDVDDMDDY